MKIHFNKILSTLIVTGGIVAVTVFSILFKQHPAELFVSLILTSSALWLAITFLLLSTEPSKPYPKTLFLFPTILKTVLILKQPQAKELLNIATSLSRLEYIWVLATLAIPVIVLAVSPAMTSVSFVGSWLILLIYPMKIKKLLNDMPRS